MVSVNKYSVDDFLNKSSRLALRVQIFPQCDFAFGVVNPSPTCEIRVLIINYFMYYPTNFNSHGFTSSASCIGFLHFSPFSKDQPQAHFSQQSHTPAGPPQMPHFQSTFENKISIGVLFISPPRTALAVNLQNFFTGQDQPCSVFRLYYFLKISP